jgi:benzodiazapine receptor
MNTFFIRAVKIHFGLAHSAKFLIMSTNIFKYMIIFLVINFAALTLGGLATSSAVNGEWYLSINKAPWTPPGWAFGAAWTTIMVCFSIFMAFAWREVADRKSLAILFSIQ